MRRNQTASAGRAVLLLGPALEEAAAALASLDLRIERSPSLAAAGALLEGAELALVLFPEPIAPLRMRAPALPIVVLGAPIEEHARLLDEGAIEALPAEVDGALLRAKVSALLRLVGALDPGALRSSALEEAVLRAKVAQREAEEERARADELRREAESAQRDAEEATRLKDQFLATLSHQMRTPLTSILGWVRLLRLGKASADPSGRALESIERNAQVQSQLVADLLDVQRIASGQMSLSFSDLEIGALAEAAVSAAMPAAEEAGVQLRLARPLDEELRVFGDADRLHQVFASLISNSIKFSPSGGEVHVLLQPDGMEVQLTVRDYGRGMDPSFVPRAFEVFRKEDSALKREQGTGLGLGLAIVRQLVEMHGGTVTAESAGAGAGAQFTVSLPLRSRRARPSVPAPPRDLRPPVASSGDLQGVRLLIVEDDVDTQYLLLTILEQFGARVTACSSVAEAMATLREADFDLLLSDISMPGEDGYSLIRRVRAGSNHPTIPAAALTANTRSEDRARALAAGFHAHIEKPVDPLELSRTLASLLRTQTAGAK